MRKRRVPGSMLIGVDALMRGFWSVILLFFHLHGLALYSIENVLELDVLYAFDVLRQG